MKSVRLSLAFVPVLLALTSGAWADGLRIVHTFRNGGPVYVGGSVPGPVVGHQTGVDPSTWALYGTTYGGGVGYGLVYKLTPPPQGGIHWTETRLYVFALDPDSDFYGSNPVGPLLFDPEGTAFGVTAQGGASAGEGPSGTVFQLTPPHPGQYFWNKRTLHAFTALADGAGPVSYDSRLVRDASGALYGVSAGDGGPLSGLGVVFKLTPPASGSGAWTFAALYTFKSAANYSTSGGIAVDPSGALYGLSYNTSTQCSQFYKLTPPPNGGAWSFSVLHNLCDKQGAGGLVRNAAGVFYATHNGPRYGGVFQLQPPAAGHTNWTESELHVFSGTDGDSPNSLSMIDPSGSVYGATDSRLDAHHSFIGGVVFRLDPPSAGRSGWTFTKIATTPESFTTSPSGLLASDPAGNLYTSQLYGGAGQSPGGTIFRTLP